MEMPIRKDVTLQFSADILNALPSVIYVLNLEGDMLYSNMLGYEFLTRLGAERIFDTLDLTQVIEQRTTRLAYLIEIENFKYIVNATPIYNGMNMTGVICEVNELSLYLGSFSEQLQLYKTSIDDLQTIFDNSFDVLYVSDGEGRTLRASSACEALWGKKPEELIGKTVHELEEEGVYSPSATRLALEQGKKVQIIQKTKTGRRLMVISTPIRDVTGKIVRVVNASKDITEIQELEQELQQLKGIIEGYKQQLAIFQKNEISTNKQLIYRSKAMGDIMATLSKIALVDSTVLITGESGVGKEVVANYIHQFGMNSNNPLIKVNCAALPESLLESELFGYAPGAFTGAHRNGRAGMFELANNGTLFLDEIGDMPLGLQAKLLRVVQEKQIMRLGGQKSISVNVRIIAATNQNLFEKIHEGLFRKDLYYRLNVIPIVIPSLHERKEDILPLINHFLNECSTRFNRKMTLSSEALSVFEKYLWPGNVRELQNIIERVVVTSDSLVIGVENLPQQMREIHCKKFFEMNREVRDVEVNRILPLKTAEKLMEGQLIELAARESRTIEEIARKLGVNQSTVSRKLQKLGCKLAFGNAEMHDER